MPPDPSHCGTVAVASAVPSPDAGEGGFAIAQLAEEFGITLRTLRFYEAKGFLSPQRHGAVRRYTSADHDRIVLILQAKRLGFTLREIGEMIAARNGKPGALQLSRLKCTEQINLLERQKRTIEAALAELRRLYSSHYLRTLAGGEPEAG